MCGDEAPGAALWDRKCHAPQTCSSSFVHLLASAIIIHPTAQNNSVLTMYWASLVAWAVKNLPAMW